MTVTTQKLGPGDLILTPESKTPFNEFSHQVTECEIVPSVNVSDGKLVLNGEVAAGARSVTYKLKGTFYQDFGAANSVSEWTWSNAGKQVDFLFRPHKANKAFKGKLTVEATNVGGKTDDNNEASFEWEILGDPQISSELG